MLSFKELCKVKMEELGLNYSDVAKSLNQTPQCVASQFNTKQKDMVFHYDVKLRYADILKFNEEERDTYLVKPYNMLTLGLTLKIARIQKGKQLQEVAKDIDISNVSLTHIEYGKASCLKSTRIKLFNYYHFHDELYDRYINCL